MSPFPILPVVPSIKAAGDMWHTGVQVMMLGIETQTVIAYRMLGLAGLWGVSPKENHRMISEKPPAFARSANDAMKAALTGKRPDEVVSAAVKPLRRRTKSNVRRLSRTGPRLGEL